MPSMKLSGLWPVIIYQLIRILMKGFKFQTNASKFQLGRFIIHKVKPIAFYGIKLTGGYKRFKATEKELFSIVKTLK